MTNEIEIPKCLTGFVLIPCFFLFFFFFYMYTENLFWHRNSYSEVWETFVRNEKKYTSINRPKI